MNGMKEDLEQLVRQLQAAVGANLESVVLYGSAASSDYNEQYSDVNLLVILSDTGHTVLDQIAPAVERWTKKLHYRPPLFVTEEELRSSADVFAIETLDVKTNHRVLAGRDVFSSIDVPMNLHRVQLEHELRTTLLKLRQHYLLARDDDRRLQDALAKSASSVVTLFRHALIALGRPAPAARREVVNDVAQLEGINSAPLNAVLDLREGRRVETGFDTLYHHYMEAIAVLVRLVDRAAPKQQWQRVGGEPESSSRERIG
jgi:predicted nucleotidyltransferase